jgi:UDP-2-acetamido-2-deoxy-ribo-hexuluronate aminotransferase
MDPKKVEAAITPRTKAILAVSFHGQMPNFEALNAIGAKHGIPVIEDGAQSYGAERNGIPSCGKVCTASTTSF